MVSTPGSEPGPHWWEVSALTSALSLAPQQKFLFSYVWIGNHLHVKSLGVAPGYWQMPDPCTAQICYAVAGRVGGWRRMGAAGIY